MAVINHTEEHVGEQTRIHSWNGITENDTAESLLAPAAAEKSVQVSGSFGSGSIPIEGSIDGTNYVTLKDIENTAIAPTSAGIFTIRDNVREVRPGVPTGTSASINVSILHKQVS